MQVRCVKYVWFVQGPFTKQLGSFSYQSVSCISKTGDARTICFYLEQNKTPGNRPKRSSIENISKEEI